MSKKRVSTKNHKEVETLKFQNTNAIDCKIFMIMHQMKR